MWNLSLLKNMNNMNMNNILGSNMIPNGTKNF